LLSADPVMGGAAEIMVATDYQLASPDLRIRFVQVGS